ncbi:tetratricopeptide repeat-containing sulfotransferase family protein [Lacipirellula limnantheis]|uniref:Tetratricopeptide repeat protein n=1 Tax=Lacipirellula limnantheis TaxID=2528024 RepID=A0A517U0M6_9BACT|nr:sulfotransferase [Lacipirellula limnantheis]QDT74163.1 Tetratricopeptide repeat protein [Lacipirellula limnantheis]
MIDRHTPQLRAALGFWREGRRQEAIAMFNAIIRDDANNVQSYIVPARAYAEKFEFERMEDVLARLVRRAPKHPGVHHYIGETYGMLKLPDRALAAYQLAADLPGAGPPTWMELASLYERAHRLEEAEDLIERTVRTGYSLALVWLVRGRIQRRLRRLDQAEAIFRDLIARSADDLPAAWEAWSEIALMRDAQGDYAGAVEAIEQCKEAQRRHETAHMTVSNQIHGEMRRLIDGISADDFRRWRDSAPPLEARTALLTGFPRSGTTLLEQLLDSHPALTSSEERDFIGRDLLQSVVSRRSDRNLFSALNELSDAQLATDRCRYFAAMEYFLGEPIAGRLHLDKNPAYNLTIPLVLRLFPETHLIVALRDPRDVVLSCYLRYLPLNAVSVRFLDPVRTAERYALDMSAWLKFRGLIETPWREVRYEDTVADAAGQARLALETLGLPWDDQVLGYRERLSGEKNKQVTSPSYEAVAQPIYTRAIGRWQHYEELLAPAMKTLEPFIREFGYA